MKFISISINLNNTCNLRCDYCFVQDKTVIQITPATVRETATFINNHLVNQGEVHFFGTEPLLSFLAMKAMVNRLKDASFTITTNATIINDEKASWMAMKGFSALVSYDGTEESHNRFRKYANGTGSWLDTRRGIRILKEKGIPVSCAMSVTPENVPSLLANVQSAQELDFKFIALNKVVSHWPTSYDWTVLRKNLRETYQYALTNDVPLLFLQRRINAFIAFPDSMPCKTSTTCGACRGSLGIDYDGSIYPCHRTEWLDDWKLGDVWQGLDEQKILAMRQLQFNQCGTCPAYPCAPCYMSNQSVTGSIMKLNDDHCKFELIKYQEARTLWESSNSTISN